ncbi:MAG: cupin domain-containing protein [Clostridia bacterium]|nr:cupin domain-containing protein [Clostridia bacterium]
MIRKWEDTRLQEKPNLRGGDGVIHTRHLVEADEMFGKGMLCSVMTIDPGASIGEHPHGPDAELYYIIEGELSVRDNGAQAVVMRAGDAMWTCNGETHSVRNETDKPVRMIAFVVA